MVKRFTEEFPMLKRAVVVGASSGIGAALVKRLADAGYKVAAVARRRDALEALCAEINEGRVDQRAWSFTHDVMDTGSARAVFDEIAVALDGLDVLVYTAGVMPSVGPDQFDIEIDKSIVDVNLVGAMAWINLAAERFQLQGGGTIVGIGSVAGDRGRIGSPAYGASKAALHTFLESCRNRLSRHGVHVLTIKPGPVKTPMTAGLEKLPMLIEAEVAADRIFRAIASRRMVAYVPVLWMPIMGVIRHIPSFIFRRTSI